MDGIAQSGEWRSGHHEEALTTGTGGIWESVQESFTSLSEELETPGRV
jgi:hypothetical protein